MPAVKYTPILLLEDKIDLKMDVIGKESNNRSSIRRHRKFDF